MDYTNFLQSRDESLRLPYFGGNTVCDQTRTYRLRETPSEYGWYAFSKSGRYVEIDEAIEAEFDAWKLKQHAGYRSHNQLVTNDTQHRLFGVENDLQRFTPITAAAWFDGNLMFTGEEFETEIEMSVREAFEDEQSITTIKGVTPALAQAFVLEATQRQLARELVLRAAEQAERAVQERQLAEWQRTIEGRIVGALAHSGALLLDWRDQHQNQAVVRYKLGARKFECVIDKASLQIIDSGICLEGTDNELNLSSLPSAVQEAIATGQLHVFRHV